MALVAQMEEESRRRQARVGRDMIRGLAQQQAQAEVSQARSVQQDPSGSISLSLDLPLSEPQRYVPPQEGSDASKDDGPLAEDSSPDETSLPDGQDPVDLDVLRSLFQLAGDALTHVSATQATAVEASSGDGVAGLSDRSLLPQMPDGLLYWMEAIDQALSRRLRNLSHAVNVQMMRSGLASTLLPVTLLEAVMRGQVETQPAPSNVLRLRLPMAIGDVEQGMDVLSLLLRCSELEFDSHRLRRCRRRLRDHHSKLHTMVRQQRHWQRRFLDLEARSHWQSPSDPMNHPPAGD